MSKERYFRHEKCKRCEAELEYGHQGLYCSARCSILSLMMGMELEDTEAEVQTESKMTEEELRRSIEEHNNGIR